MLHLSRNGDASELRGFDSDEEIGECWREFEEDKEEDEADEEEEEEEDEFWGAPKSSEWAGSWK